MKKMDLPRLRAGQRDQALQEVKATLLLEKVADEEKIEVGDDEINREIETLATQTKQTAEAIRATLRAAVPATIKFTDQIQVKEPPPPPPSVLPPERAETPARGPEVASPARTDTAAQSAPTVVPPERAETPGKGPEAASRARTDTTARSAPRWRRRPGAPSRGSRRRRPAARRPR